MTTRTLDQLIKQFTPAPDLDLSRLDLLDRPALKLDDTLDTGTIPVVASRRPVAATPAAPRPVASNADQFGPIPLGYGADPGMRRAAIGIALYVACVAGLVTGLLWVIGTR